MRLLPTLSNGRRRTVGRPASPRAHTGAAQGTVQWPQHRAAAFPDFSFATPSRNSASNMENKLTNRYN